MVKKEMRKGFAQDTLDVDILILAISSKEKLPLNLIEMV